jgi:hypothetical protein
MDARRRKGGGPRGGPWRRPGAATGMLVVAEDVLAGTGVEDEEGEAEGEAEEEGGPVEGGDQLRVLRRTARAISSSSFCSDTLLCGGEPGCPLGGGLPSPGVP